jgi:hypothetical protein
MIFDFLLDFVVLLMGILYFYMQKHQQYSYHNKIVHFILMFIFFIISGFFLGYDIARYLLN